MKRSVLYAIILLTVFIGCGSGTSKSNFTLWQLPSQIDAVGNSYVFLMKSGEVVVFDGGMPEEADYLRGFLASLGNHVDIWLVTHPHPDHIGALNEILKKPGDIMIDNIYHSQFSAEFCALEPDYMDLALAFYENLEKSGIPVKDFQKPGDVFTVDNTHFKVLDIKDESVTNNPYNNSSIVMRVWDAEKTMVFLADAGLEQGDRLLAGPYREDLDCDYLQMAHHGQRGVSKDFYRSIQFKACLWPTPTWVYNNDIGHGFDTHEYETVEIRNLVDSLGVKNHYVACEGLAKIISGINE